MAQGRVAMFFKSELGPLALWKPKIHCQKPYHGGWRTKQFGAAVISCHIWYLPLLMVSWLTMLFLFVLLGLCLEGVMDISK